MKEIKLSNSDLITLVDDEDYEWLMSFSPWRSSSRKYKNKYAIATLSKTKNIIMHRLIMEKYNGKSSLQVDHIDRNSLNNQKSNLRYATAGQNSRNSAGTKRDNFTSIYKGVSYRKRDDSYEAKIFIDSHRFHIGTFREERDAAIAYDIFAKQKDSEFSYLNFPNISEVEINRVKNIMANPKRTSGVSKYRNVCREKNKWKAYLNKDKKYYNLGFFDDEKEAALAYNKKAVELFGDKAKLNIIHE